MPRKKENVELTLRAIREMRTREEKLRKIFGVRPEPLPKIKSRVLRVREDVFDDVDYIRLLSEADTWKYVPEEVAEHLFNYVVLNKQYHEDDDFKVEDVPDAIIVAMGVRLLRLYLTGANKWNRKLIPTVMNVSREDMTREVFMTSFKKGAEIERMLNSIDGEKEEDEGDYYSSIPDWDDIS